MEFAYVQQNLPELFVDLVSSMKENPIEKYLITNFVLDNPCYNAICRNGGICSVSYNTTSVSYTCTCPAMFTGQHCETPVHLPQNASCPGNCLNNGSCMNGLCLCSKEYVGPSCEYGR